MPAALLAWWAVPFTRATGGRGLHNELLFAIVLGVGLLATRVWRAPIASLVLAAAVALCAVLVCVLAPTHWYGSDVAASYVLAAGSYVAARTYVRSEDRRVLVAAAVCLAGVYQFSLAFTPWWGSGDPSVAMSGTFYWHNPYAAFLLPGAIVGHGLIAGSKRPWSAVGWVSMPLCTAGIFFSSSRATLVAEIVGVVLVTVASLRVGGGIKRAVGAVALAAGLIALMPGPPLFPSYNKPWAATNARTETGQSLIQNGRYRTEFWRAALEEAGHHPAVGTGYHALATDAPYYTPSGWARSPLAHNGYLQALSEGGLLLGVPFLLAVLIVAGWAIQRLWRYAAIRSGDPPDLVGLAVAVAVLGGFAHSAVDFDWSYPAILIETAILASCVAPLRESRRKSALTWAFIPVVVLVGLLATLVPALHQWQIDQPASSDGTAALLSRADAAFGDYRPAQAVLRGWVTGERAATTSQIGDALSATSSAATVSLDLALLRDAAGARSGLIPGAVDDALAQLDRIDGSHGPWAPDLFYVYLGAGDRSAARRALSGDIAAQAAAGQAAPNLMTELSLWARHLGRGTGYACEVRAAAGLLDPPSRAALPSPTASCPRDHQANG